MAKHDEKMKLGETKFALKLLTVSKPKAQEDPIEWFLWCVDYARITGEKHSEHNFVVTPALAKFLLEERNPDNRPMKRNTLARIKSDILARRFQHNGEVIIISDDGTTNNGQHRFIAVLETDTPIVTHMTFGWPRGSRLTVDMGTPRSAADYLHQMGITEHAKDIAAVARMLIQRTRYGTLSRRADQWPNKTEINLFVDEHHEKLAASVVAIAFKGVILFGGRALLAFCYYLFSASSEEQARAFLDKLVSGRDLREGDAILACRQRLLSEGRRLQSSEKAELMFKAWNAFIEGRRVNRLVVTGTFPELR